MCQKCNLNTKDRRRGANVQLKAQMQAEASTASAEAT